MKVFQMKGGRGGDHAENMEDTFGPLSDTQQEVLLGDIYCGLLVILLLIFSNRSDLNQSPQTY